MSFSPDPTQGKHVFDLDRQYVFHSWSAQGALYPDTVGRPGYSISGYSGAPGVIYIRM